MENERFYYPYCGYTLGFCTCAGSCPIPVEQGLSGEFEGCSYLLLKHPLSRLRPQLIYLLEEDNDTD